MPTLPEDESLPAEIRALVAPMVGAEGPLLPILLAVQARYGHVPPSAMPIIADLLNLTAAEVHGVASFYPDLRDAPAGRITVRVCRAEACQSMGAERLMADLTQAFGAGPSGTAEDRRVTLEPVYCLGLCACAPAAEVAGRPLGRATAEAVTAAVAQ